jgi:hypothetical protein
MKFASGEPAETQPNRMKRLAKFPIFLDLAGKHVVAADPVYGSPVCAPDFVCTIVFGPGY